jgi:hypothetical protein
MSALLAASVFFTLLALLFFARSVSCTRRGRWLRAGSSCVSGVISSGMAGAGIVLVMAYFSYDRLVAEETVATIEFRAAGPDQYDARLMFPGSIDALYELHGDEWQIDARLIKWKPPMTILGLDPIFRLERLSGRYSAIDRERLETRTVHALAKDRAIDLWKIARRYPLLLPGVDAYYGTATYVPMSDGARYDISLSRDALIARPANSIARKALGSWDGRHE